MRIKECLSVDTHFEVSLQIFNITRHLGIILKIGSLFNSLEGKISHCHLHCKSSDFKCIYKEVKYVKIRPEIRGKPVDRNFRS